LVKERVFAYNTNKCSVWGANTMQKYIGNVIEIIYLDRKGMVTQRQIEVLAVKDGRVRAKCLQSGAPRVFLESSILSMKVCKGSRHAS